MLLQFNSLLNTDGFLKLKGVQLFVLDQNQSVHSLKKSALLSFMDCPESNWIEGDYNKCDSADMATKVVVLLKVGGDLTG